MISRNLLLLPNECLTGIAVPHRTLMRFVRNLIRLKSSQQAGSEPHMLLSNGWCEAEGIKGIGRVIEPRNKYSCGQKDNPGNIQEKKKADGVEAPEGSSPGSAMASSRDTTGV